MSNRGFIKLHRKIQSSPIWGDPFKYKLWSMCLMKAAFVEHVILIGNQKIELKKGQFITGREVLESEFNLNVCKKHKVKGLTLMRWLDLFKELGMLNIKKTNKYSLITICNWEKYQVTEQQINNKHTTDEQQMNYHRTSGTQQLNTNKNDKKLKEYSIMNQNGEEDRNTSHHTTYGKYKNIHLTKEEYEHITSLVKKPEDLINYLGYQIETTGKSYINHYVVLVDGWCMDKYKKEHIDEVVTKKQLLEKTTVSDKEINFLLEKYT